MTNREIAERLLRYARTLGESRNLYRRRAYRRAAMIVDALETPAAEMGRRALAEVPGIGEHFAFTIETIARTGKLVLRTRCSSKP